MSVDIANESDVEVDLDVLAQQASFLLTALRIHPLAELSIVLVDEPAMAQLHEKWMGEPGSTDVLSFPMDELRPGREDEDLSEGLLGDVVLCPQVAERQASIAGHSRDEELALLLTHGVLHLLGYDHAEPDEHAEMFGLQVSLLSSWSSHRAGES